MSATIRPRREEDLPVLCQALLEQQPFSGYPHRDPMSGPARDFIVRPRQIAAWVAELDGAPVGHIAISNPPDPVAVGAAHAVIIRAWEDGHERPHTELGEVCVFFVAITARGLGIGAALLDTALDDLAARGLAACLDVVPTHGDALRLYGRTGWTEAGHGRPDWLADTAPDVIALIRRDPARDR